MSSETKLLREVSCLLVDLSDTRHQRDAALAALRKARPIVEDVLKVTDNLEWWEEAHIALVQIDAVLGGKSG